MHWMPVAALIAITALAMPASAQVHRCKDANGKLIYSDRACDTGQVGGIIELKKSREQILAERLQAAEANERKYRAQGAEREQRLVGQQQTQARTMTNQPASINRAESSECKTAKREVELASSLVTLSKDEKRMRVNSAITNVNASCGSNTPLMQEPAKVIERSAHITHCDIGACYDDQGGVYHKAGSDFLTGPNGRACHRAGNTWNCN